MKKFLISCVVLLLSFCLLTAHAAPRYPDQSGTISDFANVLSHEMIDALNAYNKTLKEKAGARLNVATVHFLDGEDVKTYANALFARWALKEDDLLLVLCVGEDSFYTAAGSAIGKKMIENSRELLFTSDFRTRFLDQDYDGALGVYVNEVSRMLSKQYGVTLPLPMYFGGSKGDLKPVATPRPTQNKDQDIAGSLPFLNVKREAESIVQRAQRDFGVSWGKLLILALIFFLVLSPRRRVRKWGQRAGCSACGCGCAPLSWLFVLLGLKEVWKR